MPTGGVIVIDKYMHKHLYLLTTTLWCGMNYLWNVYIMFIIAKNGLKG